jgi:hypothetical protein
MYPLRLKLLLKKHNVRLVKRREFFLLYNSFDEIILSCYGLQDALDWMEELNAIPF